MTITHITVDNEERFMATTARRRAFISVVEEEYDGKLRARIEFMSWQPPAVANAPWSEAAKSPPASPVSTGDIPF